VLFVERSNRTENLLAGLAERLMCPRSAPLSPSVVVVQGQGMERWIAQSIARDHGICANTDFLFPRRLLEQVFCIAEGVSEDVVGAANPGWEIGNLMWWVARRIAAHRDAGELAPLARHFAGEDRDWRLVQLAHQIALVFDDYITYRPDWVASWSSPQTPSASSAASSLGPDEHWQAWLFRGVLEDLGPGHLADRTARFLAQVARDDGGRLCVALQSAFPNAIEVFAVSTLPPLYLAMLDGLAQHLDVRLSVLTPSRHYWADLWSEIRDEAALPEPPREQSDRLGPSFGVAGLLAGLGRLGGDFQRALEQISGYVESDADRFELPGAVHGPHAPLLMRLQASLLDLDAGAETETPVARDDRSLQVHLCSGPKRELEVVEAALREAFRRDPTLTPDDVIVMAPDIDALVPAIEAVFGAADPGEFAIPYRIADRSTLDRSPVAEAFMALLELLSGRAGRSEVLDWLSLEPVRGRLGLDADAVAKLGEWAARAGIRFGLDASHREALGLEASRRNTWAGGIDRLVLGHAVGPSAEIFEGLTPEPLDLLSDPSLLGAIGELESTLSLARRDLRQDRSVAHWSDWLSDLQGQTLDRRDDNAHEHGMLRAALQDLALAAENAGFDQPIPFEAMRERVCRVLEATPPAQGFLAGGVTFCEFVVLRAIPFRVIAMVGLSDAGFPRRRPAAGFDLMARHPRAGDRNARSDDRYLFLEALLSARDQLILTVPSRDLRDGSRLPPSVVVSELLDALDASFEVESAEPKERLRDVLVVEHPLHSFSPRYFEAEGDQRLVGLDVEAFEGARARRAALEAGGGKERRFLELLAPVSPDHGECGEHGKDREHVDAEVVPAHLRLEELTGRVLRSTRTFARDRLGMRLPRPETVVGDFDPAELSALDRYALGSALLADLRAGVPPELAAQRLAASARLPAAEPGRLAARSLRAEVHAIVEIAMARFGTDSLAELPFDLTLASVPSLGTARISGLLRDVGPNGLVRIDFARIGRRSELEFWIEHLMLCALVEQGADLGSQSLLVSRAESPRQSERVVIFKAVPDAHRELAQLFEWAWSVDRAPLPFFPKTSRAFGRRWAQGNSDQAWRDAHQSFYGGDSREFDFPESEEELELARVWEGALPLESASDQGVLFRFEALAQRFFEPFLAAREVVER